MAPLSPIWLALFCSFAGAQEPSDFFSEEARVVSASLQPRSAHEAPATVYVLTAAEIEASGAQTLWDLLRRIPGMDVIAARTFQGDVSPRGMNKPFNNRTLVLVDGRTVLSGFFDYVDWETIPVTPAQIKRIEVVKGPASPVFGANGMHGVVNIITKNPDELPAGRIDAWGGERQTFFGSALQTLRIGNFSYKLNLGWRSGKRFENADFRAAETGQGSAWLGYDLPEGGRISAEGGVTAHNVQTNSAGAASDTGTISFLRFDAARGDTSARAFWNRGRTEFIGSPFMPVLNWDTYDVQVLHTFSLPSEHRLTAGTGYRRNESMSNILRPALVTQDMPSFVLEDHWRPARRLAITAGFRFDRHPQAGWSASPRGSILILASDVHTVRLSGGSAFRNPTLLENYAFVVQASPTATTTTVGSTSLQPERMLHGEIGHEAALGALTVQSALFIYRLSDQIVGRRTILAPGPPADVMTQVVNDGATRAKCGELAAHWSPWRDVRLSGAYAYERLTESPHLTSADSAPRHKINAGVDGRVGGWTASLWAHWVDSTRWPGVATPERLPAYWLLNGGASYVFRDRLSGLELGVSGFNIADRRHRQVGTLQNGEVLRSRWLLRGSYRFR